MTPSANVRRAGPLTIGTTPNRLLRAGILAITGVVVAIAAGKLLSGYAKGADIEIPLRAAARWMAGDRPYLPESFLAGPGYDLPFLYPPPSLPFLALLIELPRALVAIGWTLLAIGAAAWACRRLAIPWPWVPLVLIWPPFFEALLGGNIQLFLFAAFIALLYWPAAERPAFKPLERDPAEGRRPEIADGILGALPGALKVSQAQPWVFLLRRRPRAALLGAGLVLAMALVTLPFTGIDLWLRWVEQLRRASDPTWPLLGAGLNNILPESLGVVLTAITIGLAALVPSRHAGAWLGLLMIAGNPSLRVFGLLYLLPGMLLIRREIALVAALLAATYTFVGWWVAILLVAGTLALAYRDGRWFEPGADSESLQLRPSLRDRP